MAAERCVSPGQLCEKRKKCAIRSCCRLPVELKEALIEVCLKHNKYNNYNNKAHKPLRTSWMCWSCLIIIKSCYYDYRINKPFTCSRYLICVLRSVHQISTHKSTRSKTRSHVGSRGQKYLIPDARASHKEALDQLLGHSIPLRVALNLPPGDFTHAQCLDTVP